MEDLKNYVNIEVKDGKTTVSALKETDSAAGVANIAAETADQEY